MLLTVTLAVSAAALTASARAAQSGEIPPDKLQQALDGLVEDGFAAAAIVRVRDGEEVWSGGSGVQDLETNQAVQADGYFRIGSITKTFVATALLQLAEDGKLSLNDTIEEHLPGLVPGGQAITVRHLLNHTSGLFDYLELFLADPAALIQDRDRTYQPEELVELATAQEPYFAPGQGWRYSNTNYVLVGMIIHKLTGQPYQEVIQQRILNPLGLHDTLAPGTDPTLPDPHAHGYVPMGEDPASAELVDVTEFNPSAAGAAGGYDLYHR